MAEQGESAVEQALVTVGDDERAVAALVGDAAEHVALDTGFAQIGLVDDGSDPRVARDAEDEGVVARGLGDDRDVGPEQTAEARDELIARGGDERSRVLGDDDLGDGAGVGLAQRRVGDGVVAQPEAVAVVGGGGEREGEREEAKNFFHGTYRAYAAYRACIIQGETGPWMR